MSEAPFQPKHNWAPTHSAAKVQSPQAPKPQTGAMPQPGAAYSEEAAVQTPPVEAAEQLEAHGDDEDHEQAAPERAGASSDEAYKVGDKVKVKGRGKANFEIEDIDPDGLYHFTSAKGAKFTASAAELSA